MINLLQETKKKVEEKIFSPDFQNSTEDQFLPQHFMRNLPPVPAEKHFDIRGQHWPAGAGR